MSFGWYVKPEAYRVGNKQHNQTLKNADHACIPLKRPGYTGQSRTADVACGVLPTPNVEDWAGTHICFASRDYRLTELVGLGGFGCVWKAVSDTDTIALKFLRNADFRGVSRSESLKQRFFQESRQTQRLQHPNVLPTLFSGEVSTETTPEVIPFFAMPWCEGGDLSKVHCTDWVHSVRLFQGICHGLRHLHEKGIVHRDIKPQNILFHEGRPQIADFGLAKWSRSLVSSTWRSITTSNEVLGTIAYMSPEQRRGAKSIDQQSDLFSLGLILFRIVTSSSLTYDDFVLNRNRSVHKVESAYPEVGFGRIFARLTEVDLAKRYKSTADVLNDVEELHHSVDVAA